jgi:serine/threonine protein kinase
MANVNVAKMDSHHLIMTNAVKMIDLIYFIINSNFNVIIFLDHDIWSKGHPQPADFNLGSVYDYYDIFEELGSGAFGVVHRAVEKRTGRSFAAKFISTPSAAEKQIVRKECDVMNQLIHPRLLNLHDIFDEGDEMVLITEL